MPQKITRIKCDGVLDLSNLLYSTFIGGSDFEDVEEIMVDRLDAVWMVGETYSLDFPITPDALFPGYAENFILRMDVSGGSSTNERSVLLPQDISLSVFPNPFNPTTTIAFDLPAPSPIAMRVYNLLGRVVYEIDLGRLNAGSHEHVFDAVGLPSGLYIAEIAGGGFRERGKMIVLK